MATFQRFEDLPVWQEAIHLADEVNNKGLCGFSAGAFGQTPCRASKAILFCSLLSIISDDSVRIWMAGKYVQC